MKYHVSYSKQFLDMLKEIEKYISVNLKNPESAFKIKKDIMDKCSSLVIFPKALKPKYTSNGKRYYTAHAHNFTIAYSVEGDVVRICAVFYNKRNLYS